MAEEEQQLYDEFGNYIGPDLDDDSSDEDDSEDSEEDGRKRREAPDDASDMSDDEAEGVVNDDEHQSLVVRDEGSPAEADPVNAIVLHEDKVHYPSANEVYGEEVRTAVLDEDAMDLDVPLVEPVSTKTNRASAKGILAQLDSGDDNYNDDGSSNYLYTDTYMTALFGNETTRMRRGVALVGHLHAGKTCFVDMLLETTLRRRQSSTSTRQDQKSTAKSGKNRDMGFFGPRAAGIAADGAGYPRYTDTLQAEQTRQLSLQSTPISMILPDTRGKSHLITVMDCPGHSQFHDESVAALRAVDGAVVVLDAVEGMMLHTEMVVKQAVAEGLPIVLLINKVDRLLVELKLPPRDAYYKLLNLIDSVNVLIQDVSSRGRGRSATPYPRMDPSRGNVAFSSAQHGWCFTLESFAQLYLDHMCDDKEGLGENISVQDFAERLWGDNYLDPVQRTFHKSARECSTPGVERTFVAYVLNPLYKLYSSCLADREPQVAKLLRRVGVLLSKDQLRSSSRVLLRCALSKFMQSTLAGFVEMLVKRIPSPASAARGKVARCYTGPQDSGYSKVTKALLACDSQGPLMIHCVKLYPSEDGQSFWVLGRIYSGTVEPGQQVYVLGEAYSPDGGADGDQEDMAVATVTTVAIPRGRTRTQVNRAPAGNWVLLEGIDATIAKTATITNVMATGNSLFGAATTAVDEDDEDQAHIFAPLKFAEAGGESVMKLAIEPLNPAELPKMVEGLRRISKAYPMARTRVEESGEHVLFGTGELYMDCIMHDLRHVYSDIEVKVADPVVGFRETVIETSSVKCISETANKRNRLAFIAEPLDDGLAEKLEAGKIKIAWDKKKLGRFFQTQYDWDLLSSRSVWAFGSSPTHGTNILMDDTLPSEVDKGLLNTCKSSIVQGFQWATREGPLCEEPVRGTKLKILDATLADKPIQRGGGQIIPTARRTVHSSILSASPRLLEPVYRLQIQCPGEIVDAIQPVLTRRRGHIVQDKPIPGSLLYNVKAFLPVLDSFGFETDLRTYTQGQAMVHSVFDHWAVVPGDPLDRSIILHPLEPSPPHHLARELLVKTRRRKGLSEDVSFNKFFDVSMRAQLVTDEEMDQ